MNSKRILVFGDSIVYGAWDSQGGWVERLKRDAHRMTLKNQGENKYQVINLGIGGDSSTKVLKRIDQEISSRLSKSWELVVVLTFGANDQRTLDGVSENSKEDYGRNIEGIIKIVRKYTNNIYVLGIPSLGEDVVELKGQIYNNAMIHEYEKILRETSDSLGLKFIEMPMELSGRNKEKYFSYDMIHPNDDGHELIYKTVKQQVMDI